MKNKHQLIALAAFFVLASLATLLFYFIGKYGWLNTATGVGLLIISILLLISIKNKVRRSKLRSKYNDDILVEKLMQRTLWQGQTAEQVIDAIGEPKDIDERVLKTKTKQTWKYFPSGRRRYGLRITLDDGIVVGWDKKI